MCNYTDPNEYIKIWIESFIKLAGKQVSDYTGKVKDHYKQFTKKGLKTYLKKHLERYAKIKNLIHVQPTYFYKVYHPLHIAQTRRPNIGQATIPVDNVIEFLSKCKYIAIHGDAGSGKSTLVKHMFLSCVKDTYKIPILVELRYMNETNDTLIEYIKKKIFDDKLAYSNEILDGMLAKGRFVIFFDGFDELRSDLRSNIFEQLNRFIYKYGENNYIVTTRWLTNMEMMPLFENYWVQPLLSRKYQGEIDNISNYIRKQCQSEESETAERIISSIDSNVIKKLDGNRNYILDFLSNPLLLNIYIYTFKQNSIPPEKKNLYYKRVVDSLFASHDGRSKIGFHRENLSGLTQDVAEKILGVFSIATFIENQTEWTKEEVKCYLQATLDSLNMEINNINNFLDDMTTTYNLWTVDEDRYEFIHNSIQEYYAANYVSGLSITDKEETYAIIKDKLYKDKRFFATKSFLSLCEELDPVGFAKFYIFPYINEFRAHIQGKNNTELTELYIQLLVSEIYDIDNISIERSFLIFNDRLLKYWFILAHTIIDLRDCIYKYFITTDISKLDISKTYIIKEKYEDRDVRRLLFESGVPKPIKKALKQSITIIAKQAVVHLDEVERKFQDIVSNDRSSTDKVITMLGKITCKPTR
jgi:energy-coupling factor transporter ATP-binding protein EcfA2